MKKICKFCGCEFEAEGKQKYCCREHMNKFHHTSAEQRMKIYKQNRYGKSLGEIQKEAEAAGMSYGMYVARKGV